MNPDEDALDQAAARRREALEARVRTYSLETVFAEVRARSPRCTPITEATLLAFERQIGTSLPEEYRAFLRQVGLPAWAPSPWGELVPLGIDPIEGRHLAVEELARIGKPFTGSSEEEPEDEADWRDGALALGYGGDTMLSYLVTTGPERGQVWEQEAGSLFPAATSLTRPVTFREWYAVGLIGADEARPSGA